MNGYFNQNPPNQV